MYVVNRIVCDITPGRTRDRIESSSEVQLDKDKIFKTYSLTVLNELSEIWRTLGSESPFAQFDCITNVINLNEIKSYDKIEFKYGKILHLEVYFDEFVCEFVYEGDQTLRTTGHTTMVVKVELSNLEEI